MSTRPADYTFYRRYLPHWQPDGAILFVSFRLAGSLPRPVLDRLRREKTQLDSAAPRPNETPAKQRLRIRKRLFALTDEALAAEIREGLNAGWKAGATVAPAFQPGVMEKRLWLGDPRVAEIVRGSLVFWDGKWFRLHRYVIMPNHVHILIEPLEKDLLEKEPAGKPALLEPALRKPGWKAGATVAPAFPPASSSTAREEAERHWLHSIMHSIKGYSAREANRVLGRRGSFWQREFFDHWARDEAEYARIVDYMDQNPVKAGLCGAADQWKWSSAGEETQTYS